MRRQLEFQRNSGKSAACPPVFQPSVSVTTAWNWSTKRNSQIKQSLIAPGAQPACQSRSDSKRGEFWTLQGILTVPFSSLLPRFWKSAEFLFSPKGPKTYGMLFHASSARSMNTWVLENNQPFLWHEDDAMQRQWRNLLGNFANISRNVLGCANGTEADHQRVRTDTGSFQDSTTLSDVDLSDKINHLLAINYQ